MTRDMKFGRSGSPVRLTLALVMAAMVAAPAQAATCPVQTLVMASTRDFKAAPQGRSMVFETLLQFADAGRPAPMLARSWAVSPDGRTYIFKLRTGVRFHDGAPFTAETAVRSIMAAAPTAGFGRVLEGVEALEGGDLRVRLKRPYWPLLYDLAFEPTVKMAGLSKAAAGAGETYVGTGPFRLLSYTPNGEAMLARNENYWGGKVALERLLWRTMPDTSAQIEALKAGSIDVIGAAEHHGALAYGDVAELESDPRFAVDYRGYGRYQLIDFNVTGAVLNDVLVRRALDVGIDRAQLARVVLAGRAPPATTLNAAAPGWPIGPSSAAVSTYDPAQAGKLLDEAGWRTPAQGGPRSRNGAALKIELLVNAGEKNAVAAAEFLRTDLLKLGVVVNVAARPGSEVARRLEAGEFEMHVSHSCSTIQLGCLGASGKYTERDDTKGLYASPELDALFDTAFAATEGQPRRAAMDRVWTTLHAQAVSTPLFDVVKPIVRNREVDGVAFGTTLFTIDLSHARISPARSQPRKCEPAL